MSPDKSRLSQFQNWYDITPPDSFTYQTYAVYTLRALPRFGIGPAVIVGYQFLTGRFQMGLLLIAWMVGAFLLSLVGFAIEHQDPFVALALLAIGGGGIYGGSAWYLARVGLERWVVLFALWFGVLGLLFGYTVAQR